MRWPESGGGGKANDLVSGGESSVHSCRYSAAVSRCRRGRKCGDIPLTRPRTAGHRRGKGVSCRMWLVMARSYSAGAVLAGEAGVSLIGVSG